MVEKNRREWEVGKRFVRWELEWDWIYTGKQEKWELLFTLEKNWIIPIYKFWISIKWVEKYWMPLPS